MRKNGKIIISLIIITSIIAASVPITFILMTNTINYNPPQNPQYSYVNIYVNSTIFNTISPEIQQYKQDIITQGYNVSVYNWTDPIVENLKTHLINSYNSSFKGAVLVGDLPYARYLNGSVFPCDLFLMDLDGMWGDLIPPMGDNIYDLHSNSAFGDIYPEIWIGRINPESLNNLGQSSLATYQDYFDRNHAYRTGQLIRPNSALLYVDDDYIPWNSDWYNDLSNAYSNITHIGTNTTTNDADYENRLTNSSFEWVHVMVHSFAYQHQFGPSGDGSQGITTNTEINNTDIQALFYNLFACSACDFSYTNNLGSQYLFSNNKTLTVIGSTKTGSMWMQSYFYTPLGQGKTIGESFKLWWWNPLHGPMDIDSQGMCILGDPLLTI